MVPEFLQEFESGREDLHVPSYDSLNHLRRAEGSFEGRENEFSEIESQVFDGEMGRVTLKKTLDECLGVSKEPRAGGGGGEEAAATHNEVEPPEKPLETFDNRHQLEISSLARKELESLTLVLGIGSLN